ncbi:hypothetical protein EVAR_62828_1 [Eumeta japonica]|uniref:Uncharacterized protein n=1 Tax=Eumeta variegata TaxID=151549 RepID=A0A4C2A9A7_EUMVA|nr:hypothetical protein EVAR_62828_1 [Eumeta japonica]
MYIYYELAIKSSSKEGKCLIKQLIEAFHFVTNYTLLSAKRSASSGAARRRSLHGPGRIGNPLLRSLGGREKVMQTDVPFETVTSGHASCNDRASTDHAKCREIL